MRKFRRRENWLSVAVAAISLCVYVTTANRTVSFIDAGELATVAVTLGIAHPTGYPLFTLLGRLTALIPVGEEIWRLNLLASVLVAFAAGMFVKLVVQLGRFFHRTPERAEWILPLVAAIGGLILAFSATVWSESVSVEVYPLHLALLMTVSYAFIRGIEETRSGVLISRWFLIFSFVLGLSFTNHMTTLLLAPAFLYLFFVVFRFRQSSFLLLLRLVPWFLGGLSLYLYLPIRSAQRPMLDWGHPAELTRFFWHVSGKQYRSWIFSSMESAEKQFNYFLNHVPREFGWLLLIVLAFGVWTLLWEQRRLLVFTGLLVLGCLAYAVNYDIHDIDSYFLLAYVGGAIFIAFGLEKLVSLTEGRKWVPALVFVLMGFPILQWSDHRGLVDESNNTLVHDYTESILRHADSNAVLLTFQWDYFVSASYYAQYVRHERPDIVVIDKELLRRSWYLLQLERNHPELMARSRIKIQTFLQEVYRFEHDLPYDGAAIESAFNGMINDIIQKCLVDRPVYVGGEVEPQFAPGLERIPDGLLFRLQNPGSAPIVKPFSLLYMPTRFQSDLTAGIRMQYERMLALRVILLRNRGKTTEADRWSAALRDIKSGLRTEVSDSLWTR